MIATQEQTAAAACQMRFGNSCGSGSVVGHFQGGSLVISNHHVTGGIGRRGSCRFASETVPGNVILSAYSTRTLSDWSLTFLHGFQKIQPVKMSKVKPLNRPHWTVGSPRCVFPLVRKELTPRKIDATSKLILFSPDAIGGQSGSAVWDADTNIMQALIAWSWGGQTGAMQTSEIFRQLISASVDGGPRPEGLIPLDTSDDIELVEGFHVLAEANGGMNIRDYPIWHDATEPPTEPPSDDPDEPHPPQGDFVSRSVMIEYLRGAESLANKFRQKLESAGAVPEQQMPSNGNTFGL